MAVSLTGKLFLFGLLWNYPSWTKHREKGAIKKNLLVPAPACVVHHMTQRDHKYFRQEKNHLSREINTDVKSAASLTALLSVLWRTLALWIVPNSICWQELPEKQRFTRSCFLQSPPPGALARVVMMGHSLLFYFSALEPLLSLFNDSGTKSGGLVWFTVTYSK